MTKQLKIYQCNTCCRKKDYTEMRYIQKGAGKCLDCHNKSMAKTYVCKECGQEKIGKLMHSRLARSLKCEECFQKSKKVDRPPVIRATTLKRCKLCKAQRVITDFDVLPNCSRDTICKHCRDGVKANEEAGIYKKPICLYCKLPILHPSEKTGAYHKCCKAKRNAEVG